MAEIKKKNIVVCADDFGMNTAVNDGILHLAQLGRLNATSCLVEGPAFSVGVAALRDSSLQIGLHLNFTEAMGRPGLYMPVGRLILQTWARRLDMSHVAAQVARQLDLFEDGVGRPPDFIDGHQHVHQFPQIRTALLDEIGRRYAGRRLWLRNTCHGDLNGLPAALRFKAYTIEALGARHFVRRARRGGWRLNRSFLGVYDFKGGQQAYASLLPRWLEHARDGDAIMCHPAAVAVENDGLGPQRAAEFRVLGGSAMQGWLERFGLELRPSA